MLTTPFWWLTAQVTALPLSLAPAWIAFRKTSATAASIAFLSQSMETFAVSPNCSSLQGRSAWASALVQAAVTTSPTCETSLNSSRVLDSM